MGNNANNTLLALMLALQELETPLSEEQQSGLSEIAAQLALEPDAWESDIQPILLSIIEDNANLHQFYQAAKSELDRLNGNIPTDLLPNQAELEEVVPGAAQTRGFDPEGDESDFQSNEINNMVIGILATSKPAETVKKLSRFEQLKKFLRQPVAMQ